MPTNPEGFKPSWIRRQGPNFSLADEFVGKAKFIGKAEFGLNLNEIRRQAKFKLGKTFMKFVGNLGLKFVGKGHKFVGKSKKGPNLSEIHRQGPNCAFSDEFGPQRNSSAGQKMRLADECPTNESEIFSECYGILRAGGYFSNARVIA